MLDTNITDEFAREALCPDLLIVTKLPLLQDRFQSCSEVETKKSDCLCEKN